MNSMDGNVWISSYDWIENEGEIWLSMANGNGICRIDRTSGNASIIAQFHDYNIAKRCLYYATLHKDGEVIFLPYLAKEVAVYNIREKQLRTIALNRSISHSQEYDNEIKFTDGLIYGTSVYMFGYQYPAIVKMNIETMELTYLTDWVKDSLGLENRSVFFAEGHARIGSYLYLVIQGTNILIKLNLDTDTTEVISMVWREQKYMSVLAYMDKVCMLSWDDSHVGIILWDPKEDTVKEYFIKTQNNKESLIVYWMPVLVESVLYLFPLYGTNVYAIDLETGKYDQCEEITKQITKSIISFRHHVVLAVKNIFGKIVFQTGGNSTWHEYDPFTKEIKSYGYVIQDDCWSKKYWINSYNTILSESNVPLKNFVEGLRWRQSMCVADCHESMDVGKIIYESSKNMIMEGC